MKLAEFLKDKTLVDVKITRVSVELTENNGEKIAVLSLSEPIPLVEGSRFIVDDDNKEQERMKAYDVETLRVHERDMEAEGIEINEDGTGFIKADKLRLDVSNSGDVWVTSKSFRAFVTEKRNERRNERTSGIISKMKERGALSALKSTGTSTAKTKPDAVAAAGG